MNATAIRQFIILVLATMPAAAVAAPIVPGLDNKHPLSPAQAGTLLIGEMRCAACHTMDEDRIVLEKAAPDLADVGSRVNPAYLEKFIASPSEVHVGTTMPDMLHSQSADKRAEIARAITHFLVAQSPQVFKTTAAAPADAEAGKDLFHSVGCIACHSPRDENGRAIPGDGDKSLAHVPAKYSLTSLADFLFQPHRVRPSGRMPDMKLTRAEANAIASYLLGEDAAASAPLKPQDALVASGKNFFQQFNCAACHKLGEIPSAPPAGRLDTLDLTRGCLSATAGKSPRFHFSEKQAQAIRAALSTKAQHKSDKGRIDMTLTAFNCVACHVRDDYGGVSEKRSEWFQTTEQNLGDDARIPPQLTLIGAKLQPLWLKKVLFDGESVRPYMLTRMPQYGEANLRHLPDLVDKVDTLKPAPQFALPTGEKEKQLRAAGHRLLGDQGLNCVTCHTFNGKASQGFKGIDLMTSYQRLKPDWFYHFLREPAAYRPRIIMPTFWPEGKAVRTDILDGDTDSQIEAMWFYMSLGTSARDPSGLQSVDSKLHVTDTTRTYRGRSGIAGYRGIAVGFPGGLSYAFDAETGTLAGLWRGEFISVNRGGQGSGGFNPAGRAASLARDVSFFVLPDEKAPWPLRPTMTKEAPVNPDPLYPRNRGYQFKGYSFDEQSIPTFVYHSGDIRIEDRSAPDKSGQPALVRVLKLSAPQAGTIWFRAMTGTIEAVSEQHYRTNDWSLRMAQGRPLLRPLDDQKKTSELLLKFDVPKGDSTITLIYELHQK